MNFILKMWCCMHGGKEEVEIDRYADRWIVRDIQIETEIQNKTHRKIEIKSEREK